MLKEYSSWEGVPEKAFDTIARLGVVLDARDRGVPDGRDRAALLDRDAAAARHFPLRGLSELNDRGIAAACEVDVGNAVAMRALRLASGGPAACLDWNNNYGDDDDKCILFHCGPVPQRR